MSLEVVLGPMFAGKTSALLLDHSGNAERFYGELMDYMANGVTVLDDGKKAEKKKPKPKEKEPRKCPMCFCVHAPRPTCISCGYEYPRKSIPEHEAGELKEISGKIKASMQDKQAFHGMLVAEWEDHNLQGGKRGNRQRKNSVEEAKE